MVLGHMVLCTHGIMPVVLYVMESIKGWKDFIVMKRPGGERSRLTWPDWPGFWPRIMKFHYDWVFPRIWGFPG